MSRISVVLGVLAVAGMVLAPQASGQGSADIPRTRRGARISLAAMTPQP